MPAINMKYLSALLVLPALLFLPSFARADYTINLGGSSTDDNSQFSPFGSTNGCCAQKIAQEFTTTNAGTINTISSQMWQRGTPAGAVFATIQTSNGGSPADPTGTILGTSNSTSGLTGTLSSTQAVTFTFPGGVAVAAGTTYFVVYDSTVYDSASSVIYYGSAVLAATSPQFRSFFSGVWHTSGGTQIRVGVNVTESAASVADFFDTMWFALFGF